MEQMWIGCGVGPIEQEISLVYGRRLQRGMCVAGGEIASVVGRWNGKNPTLYFANTYRSRLSIGAYKWALIGGRSWVSDHNQGRSPLQHTAQGLFQILRIECRKTFIEDQKIGLL